MNKSILSIFTFLILITSVIAIDDTTNLEYYYEFEDDATDTQGNNDGTERNSPNYASSPAIVGKSLFLDNGVGGISGSNEHVDLGDSTTYFQWNGHFTFAFWNYKPAGATAASQGVFTSGDIYNEANGKISIYYGASNDVLSFWRKGSATALISTVTTDDTFEHIVATYDGSNIYLYVDGVEVNSTSATGNLQAHGGSSNACIGAMECDGTNNGFYSGYLDDFAIYKNRALDSSEVLALYNSYSLGVENNLPEDNDHDNNETIYFSANVTGVEGESCELFLDTTSYGNATATNTSVIKGITPLSDASYQWYWLCNTAYSSTNYTFVYDTINPLYDEFTLDDNNTHFATINGESYDVNFSGNATDTYLFAWNYTIYDSDYNILFTNQTTNLTSTEENIFHTLDVESFGVGTFTQNVTLSDDHTANWIPEDWGITQNNNEVTFITDTNTITIQSEISNLQGFESTYLTDRYSFSFSANNQRSEWGFNLFCDETLYYRGDLYEFPVFVCGDNWVDFNVINNGVQEVIVKPLSNGAYNINIKTTQSSDKIEFNSIGGLNIVSYINTFTVANKPTITLNSIKSINSSNEYNGDFETLHLEEIEKMELSFTIDGGLSDLDTWYFNFTANGTDACALGNIQSTQCYSYENETYKWIKFEDGVLTSTFDGTTNVAGDQIDVDLTIVNSTYHTLNLTIDEHYNPNVLKDYKNLNFSSELYQTSTGTRIHKNNYYRLSSSPESFFSLDADIYKLDFRVNHSIPEPTQPLDAYLCNLTYVTGDPSTSSNCVLVASKDPDELQDDGTKFRAIITNDIFATLGIPAYIVLKSDENAGSRYYALKTYEGKNVSEPSYTYISTDAGATYNVLGGNYRSEANINWFFNGLEPTEFIGALSYSSTNGDENSLQFNNTWNIDPNQEYAPLVDIIAPEVDEIIDNSSFPYNITFQANDFNGDTLNVSIYINSVLEVTNLDETDTFYQWSGDVIGNYTVEVYAEKLNDPSFNASDSHDFTIQDVPDYPVQVDIYSPNGSYVLNSTGVDLLFNFSSCISCLFNVSFVNDDFSFEVISETSDNVFTQSISKSDVLASGNYQVEVVSYNMLGSNTSLSTYNISFCISNWVQELSVCLLNVQSISYTDSNSCVEVYDLPVDNGTSQSCTIEELPTPINTERFTLIFLGILILLLLIFGALKYPVLIAIAGLLYGVFTIYLHNTLADNLILIINLMLTLFLMVVGLLLVLRMRDK